MFCFLLCCVAVGFCSDGWQIAFNQSLRPPVALCKYRKGSDFRLGMQKRALQRTVFERSIEHRFPNSSPEFGTAPEEIGLVIG